MLLIAIVLQQFPAVHCLRLHHAPPVATVVQLVQFNTTCSVSSQRITPNQIGFTHQYEHFHCWTSPANRGNKPKWSLTLFINLINHSDCVRTKPHGSALVVAPFHKSDCGNFMSNIKTHALDITNSVSSRLYEEKLILMALKQHLILYNLFTLAKHLDTYSYS